MIHGYVPTGRKHNSWIGNITTKSQYNVLVSTGMACWEECLKILKESDHE